jgi:hypothetical protein
MHHTKSTEKKTSQARKKASKNASYTSCVFIEAVLWCQKHTLTQNVLVLLHQYAMQKTQISQALS